MISKTLNKGFTLVEVAIVIVIIGILLASASALLLVYLENIETRTTRQKLDTIDESLELFLRLNGRYPCPAPLDAAPDTVGFGFEIADGPDGIGNDDTCEDVSGDSNGTFEVAGEILPGATINPNNVRIGAVPTRTLNLPDDFIADAWGNRFTYAVTERLASANTYDRNDGAVELVDTNGTRVYNQAGDPDLGLGHYVVVSHGKNGRGAVPIGGGNRLPDCPAGEPEGENCDDDATFVRSLLFSEGADALDDFVSFRAISVIGQEIPDGAVMAFDSPDCPDGWEPYAAGAGRVIMGSDGSLGGGDYSYTATGGQETVTLSYPNLGLRLEEFERDISGLTDLEEPVFNYMTPLGSVTNVENRPPYIALTLCRRER